MLHLYKITNLTKILIKEATLYYLTRACEKMRHHNLAANAVTVFVNTDCFRPVPAEYAPSATYKSTCPTDTNQELREWTLSTLERIYNKDYEYRKAGIILSGLVPSEQITKRMFDDERFQKQHKLMKAIDKINKKFGKDTVRFGGIKTEGRWKMKQTRKSQRQLTGTNY